MPEYRVTWEINVEDAPNPLEAARRARGYQTKPGTTATVFEVIELDAHHRPISSVEVDLGGPGEPGHVDGEPLPE
jgi:hypothetical protein